ncbi:MAG TPA: D-alanyl-D-alanine carboxypeptidase/D-alanyl-D-alanine-endopeptidase [Nocardioidaceae bacterium]|nr:D-alanyl-D-alanine carboxypeptidase/D-alanyl-D-alanine-endopeptidase [Nocardioidaceae bacterium]
MPDPYDPPRRRLRTVLLKALVIGVVIVAAAAVGVVAIARHTTSADDQATPPGDTTGSAAPTELNVSSPPEPPAVLVPAGGSGAATLTAGELRARLAPLLTSKRFGPSRLEYAYATLDGAKPLLTSGADDVVTPASTLKLLTTTTALAQLGPDARFDTTVVRVPGTRRLVLVGGGDPLLTDVARRPQVVDDYPREATLQDLAAQTAKALGAGTAPVTLTYDDSLFAGPAVNPQWQATYIPESIVSPITALWVNEGRLTVGLAQRAADPSLAAARRFAQLLGRSGVKVAGQIRSTNAPTAARQVAVVSSAPLAAIVEHTIEVSDNEAAEVLLRQAAIGAGRPGSFVGGVATVRATLRSLGVDLAGARIYDGSGLSRADRLPVWSLVQVLQAAARADEPALRAALTSLPVAGFNGSLAYRFSTAEAGLGLVRAKTGTLTEAGVHGYAGLAMAADGEPIVFATIANAVPPRRALAVRAQLDRIAAAVTTCC